MLLYHLAKIPSTIFAGVFKKNLSLEGGLQNRLFVKTS
jgi:hypothetical protein